MPDISVDIPLKEQSTPLSPNKPENVSFSWNAVGFAVMEKKGKEIVKKVLISNNTGRVNSGQVIAIMGGSGKLRVNSLYFYRSWEKYAFKLPFR